MFKRHLADYTDDELFSQVLTHVENQVPEGKHLDYKAQPPSLVKHKDRREAAKDISSFANELGGCLIYGIPEMEVALPDKTKIGVPQKPYGIPPIHGFEELLENVLTDAICPHLPDLRIRAVPAQDPGQVVYIVWHPRSWMAPHMVQAYHDNRYYRRGLRRAVIMSEDEVRQKYAQVHARLSQTTDFLDSRDVTFYPDLSAETMTHFVCAPLMLLADRVDLSAAPMSNWLQNHRDFVYPWRPSYHGVRASMDLASQVREARAAHRRDRYSEIYRTGAVSYAEDAPFFDEEKTELDILDVLRRLDRFLEFCSHLYQEISYHEPVRLRVRITRCAATGFFLMPDCHLESEDPAAKIALRGGDNLSVDIQASGAELTNNPKAILKTAADTIYHTFGLPEADIFKPDMTFKTVWTSTRFV